MSPIEPSDRPPRSSTSPSPVPLRSTLRSRDIPKASPGSGARAFLGRHPILFLALLSPGIPEYLSGSSPVANLVWNPTWLLLGLAFNLGMYLPGVLLIREAQIRWNRGWATVFTLGAAYAIVEEGIGLSTMFDPASAAAGASGAYGHSLGVNWVWVPEIQIVHMVFSIGLPILLFAFAFPEHRGRSLLTGRGIVLALGVLTVDITVLGAVVSRLLNYWMGDAVLAGALLAIAALCGLARWLPRDLLRPRPGATRGGPWGWWLGGVGFFVGLLLLVSILEYGHLPTVAVVVAIPTYGGAYLWGALRWVGTRGGRDRSLLALSLGLITPIMVIGFFSQITLPIVLVADALALLFFSHLFRTHPVPSDDGPPTPSVALG